jgi:hypothetical protein
MRLTDVQTGLVARLRKLFPRDENISVERVTRIELA